MQYSVKQIEAKKMHRSCAMQIQRQKNKVFPPIFVCVAKFSLKQQYSFWCFDSLLRFRGDRKFHTYHIYRCQKTAMAEVKDASRVSWKPEVLKQGISCKMIEADSDEIYNYRGMASQHWILLHESIKNDAQMEKEGCSLNTWKIILKPVLLHCQ